MNQQDNQSTEQSKPKLGPGDKLQTARISIGMTLDEVAKKMHLSRAILTSLEDNSFEDITAPIFVKGYLRAYSRLVNINEDEIIQQYSTFYMDGDPPISSTSNTSPDINADDSRVKWITYIVILGLITLLSAWWWNRYQQMPETVSLEGGNEPASEAIAFNGTDVIVDKTLITVETSSLESTSNPLQLEIKSVVDSLQLEEKQPEPLAVLTPEPEQLPEPTSSQMEPQSVEIEVEAPPIEPVEQVTEESEPVIPAPAQDGNNLVINVTADTWASIKDADGKKLVYDLLKSGEQITVTGKAPFKAFLGNGYGVTMKYKGEDIDLSRVIRPDNTARIKIGQ